jgi:hypothetical protein
VPLSIVTADKCSEKERSLVLICIRALAFVGAISITSVQEYACQAMHLPSQRYHSTIPLRKQRECFMHLTRHESCTIINESLHMITRHQSERRQSLSHPGTDGTGMLRSLVYLTTQPGHRQEPHNYCRIIHHETNSVPISYPMSVICCPSIWFTPWRHPNAQLNILHLPRSFYEHTYKTNQQSASRQD